MSNEDVDQRFLERRLKPIGKGLTEGVRREIERLTELGLPFYVPDKGRVIDRETGRTAEPEGPS